MFYEQSILFLISNRHVQVSLRMKSKLVVQMWSAMLQRLDVIEIPSFILISPNFFDSYFKNSFYQILPTTRRARRFPKKTPMTQGQCVSNVSNCHKANYCDSLKNTHGVICKLATLTCATKLTSV